MHYAKCSYFNKKLKEVLPCVVSPQQKAYVQNRNTGEGGRLSNIIEITNIRQMKGFLVTMDVEKAFNSLDYKLLISVLKDLVKLYLQDRNNFEKLRIMCH